MGSLKPSGAAPRPMVACYGPAKTAPLTALAHDPSDSTSSARSGVERSQRGLLPREGVNHCEEGVNHCETA